MPTTQSDSTRVSIGEASRALGVSVDTLRRWADEDAIPYSRTVGGQRRFLLADIEALLAKRHDAAS